MLLNSEQIISNHRQVLDRIALAAAQYQCTPPQLLAVSKTKPASMVEALYKEGQRDFGENYLQDALEKIEQLKHLPELHWHFIGQIQSNKTKTIAEHFDWVHSVDRLKIARRLSEHRGQTIKTASGSLSALNICLQINLDGEDQKGGIAPADLPELAQQIAELEHLQLRGLMCIPKARANFDEQRQCFAQLKILQEQLNQQGLELDTLSMGMSGDLEAAVASESTMVRVGSDIFGARA